MRWEDQAEINAKSTIGGAARQASVCSRQSERNAWQPSMTMGIANQGRTNNASPARVVRGARGWKRKPPARAPWNAKEAQWLSMFQMMTGAKTSSAIAAAA